MSEEEKARRAEFDRIIRKWQHEREWWPKRALALEGALRALIDAVESHDNIYDEGLSSGHDTMEKARAALSATSGEPMSSPCGTESTEEPASSPSTEEPASSPRATDPLPLSEVLQAGRLVDPSPPTQEARRIVIAHSSFTPCPLCDVGKFDECYQSDTRHKNDVTCMRQTHFEEAVELVEKALQAARVDPSPQQETLKPWAKHLGNCNLLLCRHCNYGEGIHFNGRAMGYGNCEHFEPQACTCGLSAALVRMTERAALLVPTSKK